MAIVKTDKIKAWERFVESRYGKSWKRLDFITQNALKQAWWAGYAAANGSRK